MKKLILIFAMLLPLVSFGQDFKFIPLKYDRLWSEDGLVIKFDAVEHAIRDGAMFYGLGKLGVSDKWRFGVTTGFAVAWEIRDGFAWRKTDGYSWKDLFAGMAGQGIVFIGEKIFDKPKRKHDEALRKETDGLSIMPTQIIGDREYFVGGEKFFCPQCKASGLTSVVYSGSISSTLVYSQPFYDEAGGFHNHNPNTITCSYFCSNGHKWESKESGKCWCGWPNWKKNSDKALRQEVFFMADSIPATFSQRKLR